MKTHTTIGAGLLSDNNTKVLETARVIALTHHERWDGSGYPYGLKETNIPLLGRIVALCDVFDALTSDRPYKSAWSLEKSLCLIEEESGKHFDPNLVPLFLDSIPEILDIKSSYADSDGKIDIQQMTLSG